MRTRLFGLLLATLAVQPSRADPPLENTASVCTNMLDDDGDGLVDCQDPECQAVGACAPIQRDPTLIRFAPRGLDLFKSHGRVELGRTLDLSLETVSWLLGNPSGTLYQGTLLPGDLTANGSRTRFTFKDYGAPIGLSTRAGLYRVNLIVNSYGTVYYKVRAYADLSAATDPHMAIQFYVGGQVFIFDSTWYRTPNGWLAPPAPP